MSRLLATKSPGEREDAEADRLVRPAPKKKPPRHDRRREELKAEQDDDTETDPDLKGKDLSLNYKTIGGSLVERLVARYAADDRSLPKDRRRITVRNRETGKVVFISPKALRENPSKYEKYTPEKKEGTPGAAGVGTGEGEKPKPPRPRKSPQQKEPTTAPGQDTPTPAGPAPAGDAPSSPAVPGGPEKGNGPPKSEEPDKDEEKKEPGKQEKGEGEQGKGKGKGEKGPPVEPPVAEQLKIPPPKRREATEAEHSEAALLLADTLPPELASRLIASGLHPDDARELVGSYRASMRRPTGSLSDFATKAAAFHETNPDRVPPPKSWRDAAGNRVAFDQMPPEEQASAYRRHQMQVVAASLAAEHTLEAKLSFGKTVSPAACKLVARSMLGKVKPEAVPKMAEQLFEETASARDFVKLSESKVESMLSLVKDHEGARTLMQSYLHANDYKRAKDLYLPQLTERDPPSKILKRLAEARDFFKVRGAAYGTGDGGHEGQKRFETRTLSQLRRLSPRTYHAVRASLDERDAKEYRKAKRQYEQDQAAYEKAYEYWQNNPFGGVKPRRPAEPIKPMGYSNARPPRELVDEGRQLWKDLQERVGTAKTAATVASKFLISTYLSGIPMHRTRNRQERRALYHGLPPGDHYPREPYPNGSFVPTRELGESDYDAILTAAKVWLDAPVSTQAVEGMPEEQRFRQALDLALSSGRYKPDVQTYDLLLSKLSGTPAPGLIKSGGADGERSRLEKAVYARFPPDSRRKAGGRLTVMLTGETASRLRRDAFSLVALDDLTSPELQVLAKTMRVATSSCDAASSASMNPRASARDLRNPDNGASQMLRLSSEQKASANQILANFDQLAQSIQKNYAQWGMPAAAAKRLVNHLDKTADDAEALFFGRQSLLTRQAEVAVNSSTFGDDVVEAGLLTRAQLSKAARVIQRDSDEPYMDTFKNPMAPLETDSDEPYMSAYADDQSSAVFDGEDDTGRELAPEA